jgi:hypothetical protein
VDHLVNAKSEFDTYIKSRRVHLSLPDMHFVELKDPSQWEAFTTNDREDMSDVINKINELYSVCIRGL